MNALTERIREIVDERADAMRLAGPPAELVAHPVAGRAVRGP
nr:hypothetical protein [Amycolatopsis jejuensis]